MQSAGDQFFVAGSVVKSERWFNISLQSWLLPTLGQHVPITSSVSYIASIEYDFAFDGGSCLLIDLFHSTASESPAPAVYLSLLSAPTAIDADTDVLYSSSTIGCVVCAGCQTGLVSAFTDSTSDACHVSLVEVLSSLEARKPCGSCDVVGPTQLVWLRLDCTMPATTADVGVPIPAMFKRLWIGHLSVYLGTEETCATTPCIAVMSHETCVSEPPQFRGLGEPTCVGVFLSWALLPASPCIKYYDVFINGELIDRTVVPMLQIPSLPSPGAHSVTVIAVLASGRRAAPFEYALSL